MTDDRAERDERAWLEGERAARISMMRHLLRGMDYATGDPQAELARLAIVEQETLRALRSICDEFGDNDWPDSLHPADVIEKHLAAYLRETEDE